MRAQIRTYPTAQFYNELNYLQGEFTALRKSTSKKKKHEKDDVFSSSRITGTCAIYSLTRFLAPNNFA